MRCAWFWVVALVDTIMVNVALLLALPFGRGNRVAGRINAMWGSVLLWGAGTRLQVEGAEHARGGGPYLVVANHSSMFDIAAGFAAVPVNFRFVSRPFFFKVPFLGWGMALGGHVSMDPKKPREAARVLKNLGPWFERGTSIFMFPEGTRSRDGTIGTYLRGPFLTAIQNGVPILPVRLVDLHHRLPRGRLCPSPGPARMIIGAPIPTEGLKPPDAKRLAKQLESWTRDTVPGSNAAAPNAQ